MLLLWKDFKDKSLKENLINTKQNNMYRFKKKVYI